MSSKASRAGWGAVLAGMVLAAAVVGQPPTGGEQVAAGQRSFRAHCASCHGEGGRGDGSLSEMLKVRPADLTRLARANDGRFPYDRIYRVIDGRDEVRGHGPGSMPVWGLTFLLEAPASGPEESVAARIRDLLAFLRTIQEDGRTVSRR